MRERLIELLEEAKTKALGTIGSLNKGWGAWYADCLLKNDVIPVTKCKDCKYCIDHWCYMSNLKENGSYLGKIHWCEENDYCSYAARRNEK